MIRFRRKESIFTCLLFVGLISADRYGDNVALHKEVDTNALDILVDGYDYANGCVDIRAYAGFFSSVLVEPWFDIDLSRQHVITSIIFQIGSYTGASSTNIEILVGSEPQESTMTNVYGPSSLPTRQTLKIDFDSNVTGRYIRIKATGFHAFMSLCEIEVFGNTDKNIALHKEIDFGSLDVLVDNFDYNGGCIDVTADDPWVDIDLSSLHFITHVFFEVGNTGPTSSYIEIFVGSEPNETAMTKIYGPTQATNWEEDFGTSIVGRHIRIKTAGSSTMLSLCEVQVCGYPRVTGTVEMSSVINSYEVIQVQDMDTNTCILSFSQTRPWLIFDLGHDRNLRFITIHSMDLQDLVVSIGASVATLTTVQYLSGVVEQYKEIQLAATFVRYIMLQINTTTNEQLKICELEVFADPMPQCNGVAIDTSIEICCNEMIQPLIGVDRTRCCLTTSYDSGCFSCQTDVLQPDFNSTYQLCCAGVIRDMEFERSCCCGNQLIDADEYICCNGIPRTRQTSDPYCCHCISETDKLLDLVIFVETSELMRSDQYTQVQTFVNDLALDLSIDNGDVHLAYGLFDTVADLQFNLDEFNATSDIMTQVNQAMKRSGGTELGAALEKIYNEVRGSNGDRIDGNDVAILVVDSKSADTIKALVASDELKTSGYRIITIAIGAGVDDFELEYITSDPESDNLYHISSYDELETIKTNLVKSLFTQCKDLPTPSCNGLPFDRSTHICCNDVEQPRLGDITGCCGNVSYDSECSVCQPDGTIQLNYDPSTEICCQGNVSTTTAAYTCCCGSTAFDAFSQTCLLDNIVPRPQWDTSHCCHYRNRNVDVSILVDTSYSSQDLEIKEFIKQIIGHTSSDQTHFALTYFWDTVNDVFGLGQLSVAAMLDLIDITRIHHGGSSAGIALSHVDENVFSESNGDRPDALNIVVLLSDGHVNDPEILLQKANELKAAGVYIIMIGLGNSVNTELLTQVVSTPVSEYLFSALTIAELTAMNNIIEEQLADPCEVFPVKMFCAGIAYDPSVYVCCGGFFLVEITTPSATECCGNSVNGHYQLYDRTTAKCCFSNVVSFSPSSPGRTTCCSYNSLFDQSNEVCCSYAIQPLYGINTTECCLATSYDNKCSACSNTGEIVPGYNTETHVCCDGVLSPKTNGLTCCCGKSVFDPTNHVCNKGEYMVRKWSDPIFCCHSRERMFDVAILVGVSTTITNQARGFIEALVEGSDVDADTIRCSVVLFNAVPITVFDLDSHIGDKVGMQADVQSVAFAAGIVDTAAAIEHLQTNVFTLHVDRPEAANIAIILTDTISVNTTETIEHATFAQSNNIRLITVGIGPEASDEMYQLASEPKIDNTFSLKDASSLTTVADNIVATFIGDCREFPETGDQLHCGNKLYNPLMEVCCDGHLVEIEHPTETDCCGTSHLYDSNVSQCCGGNIVNKSLRCCGSDGYLSFGCESCVDGILITDYDVTTHKCCQGILREKSFNHSCCCGTRIFDSTVQICCNNVLLNRSLHDTSNCCHCIERQLDINIVADVSFSLLAVNDHDALMQFIRDIINDTDVDAGNKRFALTMYDSLIYNEFYLDTYSSASGMLAYIQQIGIRLGGTHTGNIIDNMLNNVFISPRGDRSHVENVAILITDGHSLHNTLTLQQAALARQNHITFIAVGTSMVSFTELLQITAEPSNVLQVSDYARLDTLIHEIERRLTGICTVHCGHQKYNPIEEVCCNGHLVTITNDTERECCGPNKLYNSLSSVCCGTSIVPIISANRRTCCLDRTLYDDSIDQCCGGHVISKSLECCGTVGYFSGGCKRCINGELIMEFDQTTHICCDDVLHEKSFSHSCCCGTRIFDSTVQTCCNNELVNKLPFDSSSCCHCRNRQLDIAILPYFSESVGDAYLLDFIEDIILNADIDSGNTRFALVMLNDAILYNFHLNTFTTRAAMIAHIEQISISRGGIFTGDAIQHLLSDVFTVNHGDRAIVKDIAIIVTDRRPFNITKAEEQAILARAQGITMLAVAIGLQDITDLVRITGAPANVFSVADFSKLNELTDEIEITITGQCEESPVSVYCGGIGYDPDLYVCCYNNLVAITHSSEMSCCGTSKLYNTDTAVCCQNNVIHITNPLAKDCCGDVVLYNAATETCCSSGVLTGGVGECCNGKVYNPNNEMCCGGIVYESHCNACLNGNIFVRYDSTKHICCEGHQYNLDNEYTCCCGHKSFDATSMVCCNGNLTPRLPNDDSNCCHCLNHKYDVAVATALSESLRGSNVEAQLKRLIAYLIQESDVDSGDVRIALSMYTHAVFNDFYLNSYTKTSDMLHHVEQITGRYGVSNTGLAIDNIRNHVLTYAKGDRFDAPNIVVIITDTTSSDNSYTRTQAHLAKSEGIRIIVVGIGLTVTETSELFDIASEPSEENVIIVDDFAKLSTLDPLMERILYQECRDDPTTVPNGRTCGGVEFDSDMYICCSGNIQFRHNGMDTKCCGRKSYDSNVFVCCQGGIAPAIAALETKCCGKWSYNPSRFICCDGKVKQRQASGMTRCCGVNTYDPKHNVCCNDEIQPSYGKDSACCESVSFDSRCFTCNKKGQVRSKFNSDKSLCCSGLILDRRFGKNSCCCGRRQINLLTTACCNGKQRDISTASPYVCCGDKLYNVENQVCCESRRQRKTYGNATQCCGQHVFNSKTHLCCDGSIKERKYSSDTQCCGKLSLNAKKEICCKGIVSVLPISMAEKEAMCCGSSVYNSATQICCGDNVSMRNPGGVSACCGSSSAYNPNEHVCINGNLFPTEQTCGGSYINLANQICCSGNTQPGYGVYSSCCGDVSYDIRSQSCCSGILRNKQFNVKGGCCFGYPYYPGKHLCCNGYRVTKETPSDDACCGLRKAFNSKEQICCNGKVERRLKGKTSDCCGKRSFDPTENVCCGNTIKHKTFGEYTACCGTDIFNPLVARCCDNTVIQQGNKAIKLIDKKNRRKNVLPIPRGKSEINQKDNDLIAIRNLKNKIKKLEQKLEEENSEENKERLQRLDPLRSKIDNIDDRVRKLKRQIKELEPDSENGEQLERLRAKLRTLREKLENVKLSIEDATSSNKVVEKERSKLKRILKKFWKIRKQFSQTDNDTTVREADKEINEAQISDTNDAKQLQKRVKKWKRLFNKLKKMKKNDNKPEDDVKSGDENKIRKVKKNIKQIDNKLARASLNPAQRIKFEKRKQVYMSLLRKLTNKDNQDESALGKIRRQKQKLTDIKKSVSTAKDIEKLRKIKKEKKKLEEQLQELNIQRIDQERHESQDIPLIGDDDETKPIDERLSILNRKLDEYRSLLKEVSKKPHYNEIKRRKKIVENMIERLIALERSPANDGKTTENIERRQKTNAKQSPDDEMVNDDETKPTKERLSYLKQKRKEIEGSLSDISDQSKKKDLKDLKKKVETRIEKLKQQQSTSEQNETLAERIDTLKTKLAAVKKVLSNNPDKKTKASLVHKRNALKERIQKLQDERLQAMN